MCDMTGDAGADYLAGLAPDQREKLVRVNAPGLASLVRYLDLGEAVAFLGAGVSAPLYPPADRMSLELVDAAADRLTEAQAATGRALATSGPEEVDDFIRPRLTVSSCWEALREVLRRRTDPQSGRSWTPVQELICRCAFRAVVTTAYDPGIVDARMRVRPGVSATGFTTWQDELELDRWRTGDVFGGDELPVLFAHGQHNQPDSIVLSSRDHR
jgi:hypothetical protein